MPFPGGMKVINGNKQIRHMKELRNRGATSNARFRIVPLTKRNRSGRKGR